jgi:hypothetical protein
MDKASAHHEFNVCFFGVILTAPGIVSFKALVCIRPSE